VSTFIEIRTDKFADNLDKLASDSKSDLYAGVRRPVRGFEIKDDTYAIIKVLKANGDPIPLTDAGGTKSGTSGTKTGAGSKTLSPDSRSSSLASSNSYSNFFIQRVDESRQEKSQILETFGDSYIFFFGERPRLLNISGLLMNTLDFNWRTEFWYNYENVLRGTKLVEQNARIYLYFDDIVVEGYMLGASARDDSEMPYHIPFSFQLFVTSHMYLSTVGDDAYPVTHAVSIPSMPDLTQVYSASDLKAYAQAAADYTSTTEAVRNAIEASANAQSSAGASSQGAASGSSMFQAALTMGLQAQNLTFLSVVNRYFQNRKMRFPKGIAGADSYANPPESVVVAKPQRTLALRSNIRDNVDEYINGNVGAANLDEDAIEARELEQQFSDPYELEKQALEDLAEMGLDPVQHPGGSPFDSENTMTVNSGSTDISEY
jgi:hypothetical protein